MALNMNIEINKIFKDIISIIFIIIRKGIKKITAVNFEREI